MAQLRRDYDEFRALDVEILVVGPEGAATFEAYWKKHDLPFTGLPDPKHSVLKQYGQEIKLFKLGRMPAMIIADARGVVRFVHYGHSMSDIPENAAVLETLQGLRDE